MSTLETLLKVAQGRLDEVSREAALAAERMSELNRKLLKLNESHARNSVSDDVTVLVAAGNFRGRQRAEREAIEQEIAEQRANLDAVRARLTLAFQEKSKFEQLIAQEQGRIARAAAALEQKQLDEAALRTSQRR